MARPRHWIPRNKGAEGGSRLQNHFSAKRNFQTDICYICPYKNSVARENRLRGMLVLPLKKGNIFKIWTHTQMNRVRDICGGDTSFILTPRPTFSIVEKTMIVIQRNLHDHDHETMIVMRNLHD